MNEERKRAAEMVRGLNYGDVREAAYRDDVDTFSILGAAAYINAIADLLNPPDSMDAVIEEMRTVAGQVVTLVGPSSESAEWLLRDSAANWADRLEALKGDA